MSEVQPAIDRLRAFATVPKAINGTVIVEQGLLATVLDALDEAQANGSCWDEGPVLRYPDAECQPMPPRCELPAGHLGAHRSGRTEWQTQDPYNTVLDRAESAEAERDSLRQGAYDTYCALGEDTDGARNADELFNPMTGIGRLGVGAYVARLATEYRAEMEAEVDAAEAKLARIAEVVRGPQGDHGALASINTILNEGKQS